MSAQSIWALFFIILTLGAGFFSARKIRHFRDYAVSDHSMHFILLFSTLACTVIGGATTMGFVGKVYQSGLNFIWIVVAIVLSNLFSGYFLAGRIQALHVQTLGELYGLYFGSKARFIASSIALFSTTLLFGVQLVGMGKILTILTGWDTQLCTVIATFVMILYTWAGGIRAVAITDFIQLITICLGLGFTLGIGLHATHGIQNLWTLVGNISPEHLSVTGGQSFTPLLGLFLTFFLGGILSPSMVQRYACGKSPAQSRKGVLFFAAFFLIFGIVILFLGFAALALAVETGHTSLTEGELIWLMQTVLPAGLSGLAFGALLAALMSTADSFLNTTAVIAVHDIWSTCTGSSPRVFQARIITIGIGLLGLVVALLKPEILGLVQYAFAVWAPAMLPSMVSALLAGSPRQSAITPQAAMASMLTGLLTMLVLQSMNITIILVIPSVLFGLILSFLALFTVQWLNSFLFFWGVLTLAKFFHGILFS